MVAFAAERPVLPPLHTLGLPNPSTGTINAFHESYDNATCPRLHIPHWRRSRQVSTTSSATSRSSSPTLFDIETSSSRASSPASDNDISAPPTPILSISPLSSRAPQHTLPNAPPLRFRLEPCSLADAQAIVLVPPPSAPFIPSSSMPTPQQKQQALLLLGPSLEYFRQPQRQLAKGARIHPYRITPSQRKDAHRSSGSQVSSAPL